jgi:hypothetical protein
LKTFPHRPDQAAKTVRRLAPLLRHRGVALPPRPDVDTALEGQRLAALLTSYDLPVEEQRRWRV